MQNNLSQSELGDQPQNVRRPHFPFLPLLVQWVHRNTHCEDGLCHGHACSVTIDLETQSSFPKGNTGNASNSGINS